MRVRDETVPNLCPIPRRLLDLDGAATYLSVSTWTLRDWVSAGVVGRVRLPGGAGNRDGTLARLLFDVRDLDRLIELGKGGAEAGGNGA
jgi:hypothetical protein